MQEDSDPTWAIDLMCILAAVNLMMELLHIVALDRMACEKFRTNTVFRRGRGSLQTSGCLVSASADGTMFILTFIIVDCQIYFGIHIAFYVYGLPMGRAYRWFVFSSIFSALDWALSLKRFVSLRCRKQPNRRAARVHSSRQPIGRR